MAAETSSVKKASISALTMALQSEHLVQTWAFDIDSDSASDSDLDASESSLTNAVKKRHPVSITGRRIAGGRRVLEYRSRGPGVTLDSGARAQAKLLQSITATPAFSHQSFEEMRLECYVQSTVATGKIPKAVDPVKTPMSVIPPIFNVFLDVNEEFDDSEVSM